MEAHRCFLGREIKLGLQAQHAGSVRTFNDCALGALARNAQVHGDLGDSRSIWSDASKDAGPNAVIGNRWANVDNPTLVGPAQTSGHIDGDLLNISSWDMYWGSIVEGVLDSLHGGDPFSVLRELKPEAPADGPVPLCTFVLRDHFQRGVLAIGRD